MPIGLRRNGDGSITLTGIVGDLVYELNNSTTHVEVAYPGSTYNIAGSVYSDTCQAWHAGASLAAMAAPVSGVASLDALSFEEDSGDQLVDFGQYFTGLGITYTISPDDSIASINASTGVVTYADDDALAETTFTVTGTNPAGNDTITQDVTVTAAADVTAPTISSTSPTDNATDIAITVNPTVTFDENVAFGTGLITLYDVTGAAAVETFDVEVDTGGGAGTVSISGAVLTIEPTVDLDNSNEYAIQIAATAIDDTSGNSFAGVTDTTTISFTTAAAAVGSEYLVLTDTEAATAGFVVTNRTKTGVDLANGSSANYISWLMTDFAGYGEDTTFQFNLYQNASAGTQYVRLASDAALTTDVRDAWSGTVGNSSAYTDVTVTVTAADIAAGRIYFGIRNATSGNGIFVRNFAMGGNATDALDLTVAPIMNTGFTLTGASATGLTLEGATSRNHAVWALPQFTGYADTETITFDVDSTARVLVRVGEGQLLDTTGGVSVDTIYDGTPGGSPEPITVTITSAMIAANKRFVGILNLSADDVTISDFTTSTSTPPTSYVFYPASDTSTVGVSVNSVVGADTIFDVTDSNTGATGWNGEQITVATADIETGVPFGIPPEFIDESPTRTFNTRAGLWLASDGTETAPEIESDIYWTLDGSLIAGEDGNSYVSASNEDGLEVKRYEAVAAGGIPAVGSPFVVTCRAAYPEVGLQFTGSNQWFSNWLSWGATQNVLWFMSFRSIIGANHRVIGRDASNSLFVGSTTAINLGGASETYTGTTTRRHLLVSLSGVSDGACTVKTATWTSAIAAGDPPVEATISTTANRAFSGSNNYFGIHGHQTLTPSSGSSMVLYRNAIWNMGATTVPDIFDTTVQQKFFAGSKIVDPAVSQDGGTGYGTAWVDLYGGDVDYINNGGGTAQHYGSADSGTFTGRGSENITEVA